MLDEPDLEKLEAEARARIIWGDKPEDVHVWLLGKQVQDADADQMIRELTRERATEMRKLGTRDLLVGLPLTLLSVGVVLGTNWATDHFGLEQVDGADYFIGGTWALCGGMAIYGVWRSWRGFDRLVFGAKAEGAVSDVS